MLLPSQYHRRAVEVMVELRITLTAWLLGAGDFDFHQRNAHLHRAGPDYWRAERAGNRGAGGYDDLHPQYRLVGAALPHYHLHAGG